MFVTFFIITAGLQKFYILIATFETYCLVFLCDKFGGGWLYLYSFICLSAGVVE